MKVAVLTMFNGLDSHYSLVNVVAEHLKMLLDAGIKTKVLVSQDCPDEDRNGVFADERLEWVKITNRLDGRRMIWHDYDRPNGNLHSSFFAEAEAVAVDLKSVLSDVNVCAMHDILYQGRHLVHNVAVRKVQENLPRVRFVSFTHSVPVNRPPVLKYPFSCRYTPMPNTTYVYPTQSGISALAAQYGMIEGRCRVVNNCLDPIDFMGEDVKKLHSMTDIFSPDILMVCPGRLTPAKQFEKSAALAGAIKKTSELTIKVVFCDFPCIDIEPEKYKSVVKTAGCENGLDESDIVFTSDLGWKQGFPRTSVLDLFSLSNLFVCPSYSESFGLTVLEAASRGNLLVLNQAVPALEELGKRFGAYFMRWDARNFGFDTKENYAPSEAEYLAEHAVKIVGRMRSDPVLRAKTIIRREFNPHRIWENQLLPVLEGF